MSKADEDRAALIERIKQRREECGKANAADVDAYMLKHHADVKPFWDHAERASIEVDTWPSWKRNCL